ncbi:MAG TPA: ABC transporter ATP-binding protein [Puia sp.]|uniref:ABC transporter ATP-binding protein n=1 Tax=Puia sp. TaxID=2045100 RepID=UPI002CBB9B51|nr:ABC transporter ATP-binding protein [Puia sp.]HVU95553.1 ABC transporter ATP-binding protein [Puia sp.]
MSLIVSSLSKTYVNGVQALKNVSLEIPNGMFGLLGPNGAGKSSFMRTIATLQEPDKGSIRLDGVDVIREKMEMRRKMGYLPQEFGVYPRVTAEEMLDHTAVLKGIGRSGERKRLVRELLEKVNLIEFRKRTLASYSGGMKQRFGIAQALIGAPRLIIVDEPTAGLDPAERNRFYNLLAQVGQDTIVILSTHIVDDVSALCTAFAILDNGEIVHTGSPDGAVREMEGRVFAKWASHEELAAVSAKHRVLYTQLRSGQLWIRICSTGDPGDGFSSVAPVLEDVYFNSLAGSGKR